MFTPSKTLEKFPQGYALNSEELWLPINQKESLHGWWLPAKNPAADVLLFLHGNSSNVGGNLFHAKRFVNLGFSVLLMDYRGFGLSGGKFPSEDQVYTDAQVMYDYLTQTRRIPPEKIFLYGHSLGGAIAIDLASKNPIAGLITESTFTSMFDMATRTGKYSFIPVDFLLHQRFESLAKIQVLQTPTLFIHGTADDLIPVAMVETLYQQAIAPKKLLIVPEAGHNNVASTAGAAYDQAILDFQQFTQQQQAQKTSDSPKNPDLI